MKKNAFISPRRFMEARVSSTGHLVTSKDEEAVNWLAIRNAYEAPLEASHYGLSFGIRHQSGFRASIGIQKTAIAEKYELKDSQVVIDSILGVKIIRIDLEGNPVPIEGIIPRTTTTEHNKKIYNTYELIDVPISIGYGKVFGNWRAGIDVGILLNLSLNSEGLIPDEWLQDIDIKADQDQWFKSNIGVSYQLGLSMSRMINRFEVGVSPSFRYFPNDFSAQENQIAQKYTLISGNLKIGYRF